jgi:hypothetical protein
VSAITDSFASYTNVTANPGAISQELAISKAAHDTLAALFPVAGAELRRRAPGRPAHDER